MPKVVILRGLPGAGKSTYRKTVLEKLKTGFHALGEIFDCSADHFFMVGGEYKFNPMQLGEAHASCLRSFTQRLLAQRPNDLIVVDNTNLSVAEFAPYAALALAYKAELEIVTIECGWQTAAGRNVHGVPMNSYSRMEKALAKGTQDMPAYWPHTVVKQADLKAA